jgi:hypothetical protein
MYSMNDLGVIVNQSELTVLRHVRRQGKLVKSCLMPSRLAC